MEATRSAKEVMRLGEKVSWVKDKAVLKPGVVQFFEKKIFGNRFWFSGFDSGEALNNKLFEATNKKQAPVTTPA